MKQEVERYVKLWEQRCYSDGIPDEVPTRLDNLDLAPSYKRVCMAILNNDSRMLGFQKPKSVYYHILKRIELEPKQLKLDL